jgi:microcin C transport system substrate-binding protein
MKLWQSVLFGLIGLILSSALRAGDYLPYDNTAERAAFCAKYNKETTAKLNERKQELEKELAELSADQETKRKELLDEQTALLQRLQRPDYFETLTEADLPKDLKWENGMNEPEIGSPDAKKGGTYHSNFLSNAYPPNIRCCGKEANNSFRSSHWDDIEMGLVSLHPVTGKVIPGVADKWAVLPDQQTVIFHIDSEARWSDGKKLTSRDFMMAAYVYLSPYLSEVFYRTYYGDQYWGFTTYGDDYICVRLANPKPIAPYFCSLCPFQEDFYKEFGPDFEDRYNWRPRPTMGAYEIRPEDIKKGTSISLSRVKTWWARERKYYKYRFNPDRLEYILIREEEKVFQLFLRHEIDMYLLGEPKKWYEDTEIPDVFNGYMEKATFYYQFPAVSRGLYLNLTNPLLSKLDIRIGLQHATNFQKVIDMDLRGDAERLNIMCAGYGEYSNPNIRTRPYSVEKAKEAFARAGFTERGSDGIFKDKDGRRLSFTITYSKGSPLVESIMLRLSEEAKKAGVEYKLEGMDSTENFKKIMQKQHQIAFSGWQLSPPFPDSYYEGFHSSEAYEPGSDKPRVMTNNISVFADKTVDPILEANRNARSLQVIKDTSYQLEQIFHDRAVWVPGYTKSSYRVGYWRWLRWPADFNVPIGNEPDMNYVFWIDTEMKKDTLDAMRTGRTFPEVNVIYDKYRTKSSEN